MDCTQARDQLQDLRRRRLEGPAADALVRHLDGCEGCRGEDEAEALLDRLLAERLPRRPVPAGLQARLAALASGAEVPGEAGAVAEQPGAEQADGPAPDQAGGRRGARAARAGAWRTAAGVAFAAGVLLAGVAAVLALGPRRAPDPSPLLAEAVSDHLRLLAAPHPLDVPSTDTHEVKPWFAGRLDFAPTVPAGGGGADLLGGALGYFLDRRAAVLAYGLRRHRLTLVAFPASGLPWPAPDGEAGGVPTAAGALRGFQVRLWRHGELGYALVSDVAAPDFAAVAAALAPATRGTPGP